MECRFYHSELDQLMFENAELKRKITFLEARNSNLRQQLESKILLESVELKERFKEFFNEELKIIEENRSRLGCIDPTKKI